MIRTLKNDVRRHYLKLDVVLTHSKCSFLTGGPVKKFLSFLIFLLGIFQWPLFFLLLICGYGWYLYYFVYVPWYVDAKLTLHQAFFIALGSGCIAKILAQVFLSYYSTQTERTEERQRNFNNN